MTPPLLVSIITPTYNTAKYLPRAVASALNQTYSNLELIIIDDGSTDDTKETLKPYLNDRRLQYVYQSNQGIAGARNAGINKAHGRYIALLDADDEFLPTKIERQLKTLEERPDYGVCYSDILHFYDTNPRKFFHHRYSYPSGNIFEPLLKKQFINPLSVFVRREVIEKHGSFDETLRHTEDWDLWLRWARAGVKFYYLNEILAFYLATGPDKMSRLEHEPGMKKNSLEIFTRLGEKMTPEEKRQLHFSKIIRDLQTKTALAYLMVSDKKNALRFVGELPLTWRSIIILIPTKIWHPILMWFRKIKHRLLLKKLSSADYLSTKNR